MGLENANYIAQLDETNPEGTDSRRQGDDHMRMIKGVLRKTFPEFDEALLAKPSDLNDIVTNNRGVQSKMIVMYWGSEDDIPEGWVLCNGSNNTPDLRNKFIMAAGDTYVPGEQGGSNDVAVEFDTDEHVLTIEQIPAHTHTVNVDHKDNTGASNTGGQRVGEQNNADFAIDIESNSTGGGKGHTHPVKVDLEGGNMPQYMALMFIMKVS